jgi:hypothetical protein
MRKILLTAAVVSLVLPFALVINPLPAGGKALKITNRFAPSGVVSLDPTNESRFPRRAPEGVPVPSPTGSGGCPDASETNVRANQECTNQSRQGLAGRGQGQNETAVAVNPTDPQNVLSSQNDYREGDSTCGVNWSLDGGEHWGSQLLPTKFTAPGFTAPRHYWDAGGDPTVGFDSEGRAYYVCLMFDRGASADNGDNASGIFAFRSLDGGASWSFPGVPIDQTDGTGEDGIGLIDKQYLTVDLSAGSPNLDRIYVAWVEFNVEFTASPVNVAYSDDHGLSWTVVKYIGGFSEELCPINFDGSPPGTCNANQFVNPFTAPNGDVFVTFQNYNNCAGAIGDPCEGDPNDNHNQMLIVKSTDGGDTWSAPVKVTDFYDLPDCFTYTGENFGRACVPTTPLSNRSVFRATNYPVGMARTNDNIVVTFGSYINRHSGPDRGNCFPAGFSPDTFQNLYKGVGEVDGCNNDIVMSWSVDGGATFAGTSRDVQRLPSVSSEFGEHLADQWWQWSALSPSSKVHTAYYDRSYGDDMSTGNMDVTLTSGPTASLQPTVTRVTDASMPPSNEFPGTGGYSVFLGDYSGLAIGSDGQAHPVWTDTRNPIFTFDPATGDLIPAGFGGDTYTASIAVE